MPMVRKNGLFCSPDEGGAGASGEQLAPDALIIVPVRDFVLFPGVVLPVTVGGPRSVAAAQEAMRHSRRIGFLMQRDPEAQDPSGMDLHRTGTIATVLRYLTAPDGGHHLIAQGEQRFRVVEFLRETPYFIARIVRIDEPASTSSEIEARFLHLQSQAVEALELLPQAPPELVSGVRSAASPATLGDLVATFLDISPDEKQEILETRRYFCAHR
jgi:ATP-dependent Lon protease